MEYGQQMQQAKENAKQAFYQNTGYQLERREKKTFILKVIFPGSPGDTINFNERLEEPLIIDALSDIYLESFLTFHQNTFSSKSDFSNKDKSAFVLDINEFNNQGNTNDTNTFNKIIIPHTIPADPADPAETNYRKIHKSRKLNYICSINPSTLYEISGSITDLNKGSIFDNGDMFIAEFVIIVRE